ncbi:MAG: O-antigen ligase family protein, partial [Pseudomonadota bacterium]
MPAVRATPYLGALVYAAIVCAAWLAIPHPVVGVAAAVVPLGAVVALRAPVLMATLFIAFSFFRLHEVAPFLGPFKLPLLLALAALAALVFAAAFGKIKPTWEPLFTPFLCFFGLVTIGVTLASNIDNSVGYWKDTYVKIAIMVFAIAWLVRSAKHFGFIRTAILLSGCVVSAAALYNKANGIDLVEGTRVSIGRSIGSVLGDPNDLALVLLFPAGFALSTAFGRGLPALQRIFAGSVFLLLAFAIIATQSRGGLLGIVSVSAVIAWARVQNKALLLGAGAVALAALVSVAGISDRQSGGAHEEGIDESAQGRLVAWGAAWRMAVAKPLNGVGLDNFYYNYYLYTDFWDGKNHAVHSTWFGVMGETGFLGFGVFCWMTISAFQSVNRSYRIQTTTPNRDPVMVSTAEGLRSALTGFCVSGTFLTQ